MRKEALIKKIEASIDKIYDALDDISGLLEIDYEDEQLAHMSAAFVEYIENAISSNNECTIEDIMNYIKEEI